MNLLTFATSFMKPMNKVLSVYFCIAYIGHNTTCEFAPAAKAYLFAGHKSVEAGNRFMHESLNLTPLLDLGFRLGEGTGAALAFDLICASTRILAEIKTFEEVAIQNANR